MIINTNALHIPLADKCVHTVVTSPPYYGLRDYGTAKWEGGDIDCKHYVSGDGMPGETNAGEKQQSNHGSMRVAKDTCPHCGAIRIDNQLGLEQTPDEYVANMVKVFRECKRVLRDDGTLWVNIGDSFNSQDAGKNPGGFQGKSIRNDPDRDAATTRSGATLKGKIPGLKVKDLIGIPWMLAFALRADGWYLRSDIIWAKKNCMPESVKDRPTKSHEYIFLLSKSQSYYYDHEAVKEPYSINSNPKEIYSGNAIKDYASANAQNPSDSKRRILESMANGNGRNKRDVWFVSTKPYKGAHYATFPPELITPCILAGAPEGGIVFDPFVGSGTTVATAIQLGRKGIGLDLSFKYLHENARERIEKARLPLLELV